MFDKKVFSARLRSKRGELKLSQGELAEKAGLSASTIVHYEDDEDPKYIPGADKVWVLSEVLECDPGWLLGWEVA